MEKSKEKLGLVLEGGGMRGLYTAGILDVFLEKGIKADGLVGVSAGCVFGCNYKSLQHGRTLRYNTKYCTDKRFVSVGNWIKTGNIYTKEFAYGEIPWVLDIFDSKTFEENPMEFYATATDVETGKATYKKLVKGDATDVEWMRASASIPAVSKPVELDGHLYLDGGVADSIPIEWFRNKENGYKKCIVILTRPLGYVKEKNKASGLMKMIYRKYPKFCEAFETRHIRYNKALALVEELEKKGEIFVIRPSKPIVTSTIERDAENLKAIYEMGRNDVTAVLDDLINFIAN